MGNVEETGEDGEGEAPEYGDTATEGFGVGVDFSAAGLVGETDEGGDGAHEARQQPGDRKTNRDQAENDPCHGGRATITGGVQ